MTKILYDSDLLDSSFTNVAIEAVENILRVRAHGQAISPPRHHVSFPGRGDLIFTVGGTLGEKPLAGFRVYGTFEGAEHSQIVAVWSADDGRLKGLILGERLGAIRTGAIGASQFGTSVHLTPASWGYWVAGFRREASLKLLLPFGKSLLPAFTAATKPGEAFSRGKWKRTWELK